MKNADPTTGGALPEPFSVNRRAVLKAIGMAAAATAVPGTLRAQNRSDVLVIGAGLSGLAAALLYLNSRRVMGWYTLGIWQRPLLWGLFASFIMVNLGFLLRALMPFTTVPPLLPVHAFALGGIGIITVSLMARVTLAQADRDVDRPPRYVAVIIAGMILAAVARIFLPLAAPGAHSVWILMTGVIWIISFLLFTMAFAPMLLGRPPENTRKPGSK